MSAPVPAPLVPLSSVVTTQTVGRYAGPPPSGPPARHQHQRRPEPRHDHRRRRRLPERTRSPNSRRASSTSSTAARHAISRRRAAPWAAAFGLALLLVFLVLAAQFESWITPAVIMLTVPLAAAGGLFGLLMAGSSLNIYSARSG